MDDIKGKRIKVVVFTLLYVFAVAAGIHLLDIFIIHNLSFWIQPLIRLLLTLLVLPFPIFSLVREKESFIDIGFSQDNIVIQFIIGIIIALVMSLVLVVLPFFIGAKGSSSKIEHSLLQFIFQCLYSCISVSFVQIFIFNGVFYHRLYTLFGSSPVPILLVTILTGLYNLNFMNIYQACASAIIGTFFCFCMEGIKNCSLLSLIVAYGIFDIISVNRTSLLSIIFNR